MYRSIVGLSFCFLSLFLYAQEFTTENYYVFPINPGQPNYLAGTMGELRSSHFHAGIDIKTGGQIGLPVRATADGYVWRIKISPYGYGKALYLRHKNGTTSVYAHLDKLNSPLDKFITDYQYEEESYSVEIFPNEDQFVYRQGETIGFSGNSGSSTGPHLHFEIRDMNQRALDPLRFKFSEIVDDMTPVLKKIAFSTLSKDARINDTFGRLEFEVIKVKGQYTTRVPITLKGNIGIEVYAYDLMNGVWSKNGIPDMTCRINGDTVYSHRKKSLSFGKQRNILAHFNYQAYRNGRPKFDKLYLDDGNTQDFYIQSNKGIHFTDSLTEIEIFFADSYNNISTFKTKVNSRKIVNKPDPWISNYQIHRDFIHFKTPPDCFLEIYMSNNKYSLMAYRTDKKASYFVWDMREGIPDSINFCGEIELPNFKTLIPSGIDYSFIGNKVAVDFTKYSLFDSLYLNYEERYDTARKLEIFQFNHRDIALKGNVEITFKPQNDYVDSLASVYAVYGEKLNYVGGKWHEDKKAISFKTKDLVTYTLLEDRDNPTIKVLSASNRMLDFKIDDQTSGVSSFNATLNGQFILMEYDAKNNRITSKSRTENIPFIGEFILKVNDAVGNQTEFTKIL